MTDHHDDLRVAPDPVRAEELRQRLHARLTSVSQDSLLSVPSAVADRDGREGDLLMLETEDQLVVPRRRSSGRRLLAAAAVAVVVTFIGALLVVRSGDDKELDAVTAPPTRGSDGLPVGPHIMVSRVGSNEDRVAVTIPAAGWFAEPDEGSLTKELGDDDRVTVVTVPGDHYRVPADICSWQAESELVPSNDGSTRDHGLVASLREQTYGTPEGSHNRKFSAPVDISIDGAQGQSVTGEVPHIDPSGCDEHRFCSLLDRDGARCLLSHVEPNALVTFWIVYPRPRNPPAWVIAATYSPTTGSELLAEMNAIVDSMSIVHG